MRKTALFSSFDLVPEFGRRLRDHWAAALMGGTIVGIGLFVWTLLGSPPHWAIGLVLVGALLFSAYFVWRNEFLARQQSEQKIRVRIDHAAVADGTIASLDMENPSAPSTDIGAHLGMHTTLTVFNAGPPTVLDDWELILPDGSIAKAFDTTETRYESRWPRSRPHEEFKLIDNFHDLAANPLGTGQRKQMLLEFQSADLDTTKAEELKKGDLPWVLIFRDASGTKYKVNLIRQGYVYKQIEDPLTDLTPIPKTV